MYGEFILRNVNYNCAFFDSQQWEANNWNTSPKTTNVTHTHTYIYIYIYYMYVYMYMYIYMHINIWTVQIIGLYGYIFPITIELVCTTCCRHFPINAKHHHNPVWYIMMTSSSGNIFRVTGPLCGEFTSYRWFPLQKPVTRGFDVFFDLRLE